MMSEALITNKFIAHEGVFSVRDRLHDRPVGIFATDSNKILMAGTDTNSAQTYHEATKHSEVSVRSSAHYLDWDNKPAPFKEYHNLPSVALPRDFPLPKGSALDAVRGRVPLREDNKVDLGVLAELLFFSAGLTRKVRFGKEMYYMRAASATGALYPIELYIVAGEVSGLDAGVYHFNPLHFSLESLRKGDYRGILGEAGSTDSSSAPLTLVFASIAWRNAWKYEARSYRHWFWDSGVIVANLLATANAEGLPSRVILGFVDLTIDNLLGLKRRREATVALAVLGASRQRNTSRASSPPLPLSLETSPLSTEEVDYPIIWDTNEASQLTSRSRAESWKKSTIPLKRKGSSVTTHFPLRDPTENSPSLEKVILLRGSSRKFSREPISFEALSTILNAAATRVPLDFLPEDETLIDFYFVANDVRELASGSYFYNPGTDSVEQLKPFSNRSVSGYLCLEQQLFSDASVVFFLMTNLESTLESLGNRGYRAAQLEAGIRAGKIYLSAYATGIGASGSTFFDDAVTEFFSPHAKDKSPMIAVGIGVPAYKARPGKVLPQLTPKT